MTNYVEFPHLGWKFTFSTGIDIGGKFTIYWYGILIALGFLLAVIYAFKNFKRFGLDPDKAIDAVISGAVGGIIGARAYYVIFNFALYKDNLAGIFDIRQGGLAIYGAVIGGLLFGAVACKIRKVSILSAFDVASLGFLIGQAVGRWGNFLNQEAFGSNTNLPWGMTGNIISSSPLNKNPSMPVHPCFLYESLWCILGFILLHRLSKKRKFEGQIFLAYIGWNGFGRFFIEGLRTDSLMLFGTGIKVSQLLAALAVLASVTLTLFVSHKKKDAVQAGAAYSPIFADVKAKVLEDEQIKVEEVKEEPAAEEEAKRDEKEDDSDGEIN